MTDLVEGLARHLAARGLGAYRRGTPYTPPEVAIVLGGVIPSPDRIIALTPYVSGPEPDSLLPFTEVPVQVRCRGTGDESVSRALAAAVWSELHGLGPVELPGGVLLMSCIAVAPPTPLGRDEAGRHEHVFNTRCDHVLATAHRPQL